MDKIRGSNFPDPKYLERLASHLRTKVESSQTTLELLIMLSGASLNWISDLVTDENILWTKEELPLKSLYLTGTTPEWNEIVIDKCQRSPLILGKLMEADSQIAKLFCDAKFVSEPILVRLDEEKLKVLDGMHRVIAAIRDKRETIFAFVAKSKGIPAPKCEPHVVYDLLKPYIRGMNRDKDGLIISLRFLRKSYVNVEDLLKNRFNKTWIPSDEIQEIIQESLID